MPEVKPKVDAWIRADPKLAEWHDETARKKPTNNARKIPPPIPGAGLPVPTETSNMITARNPMISVPLPSEQTEETLALRRRG